MDYQVEKMAVGQLESSTHQIDKQVESELGPNAQQMYANELEEIK